jgi:hypothetical protein
VPLIDSKVMATQLTIRLDLAALPAEGVKSFIGGATYVDHDGKAWSGFVTDARVDGDEIRLTVEAVEAEAWTPS